VPVSGVLFVVVVAIVVVVVIVVAVAVLLPSSRCLLDRKGK